ncbi:MAG: class I mannose-6-phosphate isomerase, partial [Chloroflexota bacterium]|nr:class I mannose-6-phosphate isomerase [Chloroflexota bacterium]
MNYPLVVDPRLIAKPWGGRRLKDFGITLPANESIGEALLTAGEATVRNGPAAGRTLAEIVAADPFRAIGTRGLDAVGGRAIFPLLIKLIDATANLSIQVHPGFRAAAGDPSKTEAWHILAADPGAVLYAGLRRDADPEAFAAACARATGDAAAYLRQMPARVGATVLISAGTAHAIGAGVFLYEVQQPVDVTFRLDDWGRGDENGASRELHLEEGLAALAPESRPDPVAPSTARGRRLLTACHYFALERIALAEGERADLRLE